MDRFSQQILEVRQRQDMLSQQVNDSPIQQELLLQAIEQLQNALEQLHVAEEELRQQQEELLIANTEIAIERQRYQELFDFAPDGYLVTDTNGKIIEANRTAAELLKFSKHYLPGKLLINFVPTEERRAFRTQMLRLRHLQRIDEWEVRLQTNQQIKFYASISVTTVRDKQGNLLGWRWLVRNINTRKQEEEQLRSIQLQNLQLEEASRQKSQFLAMVSHELRTPMNAVLGYGQLLLRKPHHQVAPDAKDMVQRIVKSGSHLLKLIEEILDFSRLEAGRLELNPQPFNLAELVTATSEELRTLAQQKNLTLDVDIKLQNCKAINDNFRVRQILINLLSNAIKFTDIGGVAVEVIEPHPDRIAILVKDTGIGIPETELQQIFQEFRQVNQSITRKQGGTGLGLAIVDKLVRLMRGTITVDSQLGEGSTFQVELPREVKIISN